jgi:glycosyltransferase involved in cell wall biosynthesis
LNQTLTICMLAPFGIRPKGTLAARMLPLAQALVRRGHRVTIVAPPVHNPEDAGSRVSHDGVLVEHTRRPGMRGPLATLEQAGLLLRAAQAAQPDLLHLFKPKGYGGLAVRAAALRNLRIPLVVDTDDWEGRGGWNDLLPYPWWARQLFDWQERDLPRFAAAVTVASRTLERQVLGAGVPAEQIFYLPNGADARTLAAGPVALAGPERPPTLLLYTRFWEFDVRLVIAALVGLAALRPGTRLLIVGRGERGQEQELLRLAERSGVASMVDYRGWAEPAAIPGLMAQADAALVPLDDTLINRARGLAKLLELMAAGLPIVASRVGQVAEYLEDGRSGLLAPAGDAWALAQAAAQVLGDAELRRRLSAGARVRAALFGWDRLAPAAEAAYSRALRLSGIG